MNKNQLKGKKKQINTSVLCNSGNYWFRLRKLMTIMDSMSDDELDARDGHKLFKQNDGNYFIGKPRGDITPY